MSSSFKFKARFDQRIDKFRQRLAHVDALPQLTLLGLLSGIAAALIIVAFRLCVDGSLQLFLGNNIDSFESLAPLWRFLLPVAGALIITVLWVLLPKAYRAVSVSHVLDRLHNHQGQLPWKNTLAQFVGGAISLVSGQSVGREGPAVHMGAGAASLLGQWLKLPNNSLRILVGCGVAAAIAASFNTPIAGVIFAMEVVLMEYTITGFLPVILASVSGATISQLVFGNSLSFPVSYFQLNSLLELPYVAAAGLVVGLIAGWFMRLQLGTAKLKLPLVTAIPLAGLLTGTVAIVRPEVLGLGYDTLAQAMLGDFTLSVLVAIIAAKMVLTAVSIGVGIPGGIIGPILVLGGCIGGALGLVGTYFFPETSSSTGLYVLLGMAAMMAAVLNAPLAALMAVLELTYNPNSIFPAMLMIVVACITVKQLFKLQGLFVEQLQVAGKSVELGPGKQILSRVGVRSVMQRDFTHSDRLITPVKAQELLANRPTWLLVRDAQQAFVVRAADVAQWLESDERLAESEELASTEREDGKLDLSDIPAQRFKLYHLHPRANLFEAKSLLNKSNGEVLYIAEHDSITDPIMGLVTRSNINNYYQV